MFGDILRCPILGPLLPLFGISGNISSGCQSQSGFILIHIAGVNVMYIPWDPPLVLHMLTSWQPVCSWSLPHMHQQRWELTGIQTANHPHRRLTLCHCATQCLLAVSIFGWRVKTGVNRPLWIIVIRLRVTPGHLVSVKSQSIHHFTRPFLGFAALTS